MRCASYIYIITTNFLTCQSLSQDQGVTVTSSNIEVIKKSSIVWIATKPHAVAAVLREVSPVVRTDQLFLSLAAGTTLRSLSKVHVEWICLDTCTVQCMEFGIDQSHGVNPIDMSVELQSVSRIIELDIHVTL